MIKNTFLRMIFGIYKKNSNLFFFPIYERGLHGVGGVDVVAPDFRGRALAGYARARAPICCVGF